MRGLETDKVDQRQTLGVRLPQTPVHCRGAVAEKGIERGAVAVYTLMSRIERKYCLISTSCLPGLFGISILLHI